MAQKIRRQLDEGQRRREISAAKAHHDFLNRENQVIDGFSFDQDTFENLIDYYTPLNDIPLILNVTGVQLDTFCKTIYGFDFKTTYDYLSRRSQFYTRKAFTQLAYGGNAAAIKVASESYMGLINGEDSKDSKVVIMGAIPVTNVGNGSKN